MTVKQLIVGTLLGATAVAMMLHRLPKPVPQLAANPSPKQEEKSARLSHRPHRKHVNEERLSLSKVVG